MSKAARTSQPVSSSPDFYDWIVIGAGPAGQKAAVQAAKVGKRVAVIERHPQLGGGCAHTGTLPSKSFRESVYRFSLSSRGTMALEGEEKGAKRAKLILPDMGRLVMRRHRVVEGEAAVVADQFARNHIDVIEGDARFLSAQEIEVTHGKKQRRLRGSRFLIAVGSHPVLPAGVQTDSRWIVDSDSVLELKKLPKTMIVLGAGIIGCEYASMFSTAGTQVTLVDRRNQILSSVDTEIVSKLQERFQAQKMKIVLEAETTKIEPLKRSGRQVGVRITLASGKKLEAEVLLIAQGRGGNTQNLGLDAVGVTPDARGLIPVNAHFQTVVPHIYAAGDVIGQPALASTSMEQGRTAARHAFGLKDQGFSPLFPYGIYTIPEISMVGPTEAELKTRKIDYVVGRAPYREVARGQIVGDRWGLLKLLVDRKTRKLLGVHIIGDGAADLVHIGQAVMAFGGDLEYFVTNVFNYPTLAEAYKMAAFHALNQTT